MNYPIPELGNCRDTQECKLYCDIPANTPSCWSYGKYVMNNDVLGETTVNITYPIPELGNCATAQECFIYCNQPQNQTSCLSYARNNGLVKQDTATQNPDENKIVEAAQTELGCSSKDSCMSFCNDPANLDRCRAFAQKHGLEKEHRGPPREVIEKAKTDLGCNSESTCMSFCEKPENREKCFAFAKENNLIKPEDAQNIEKHMEQKAKIMETAKTELGCDSIDSCNKFCSDPANREKCMSFNKKVEIPSDHKEKPQSEGGFGGINKSALPCTSETECKAYCQTHPKECPGNSGRPNTKASDTSLNKPLSTSPPANFSGTSGCKTESECKEYCKNHPDQCPGFPKTNSGSSQKPDQPNTQSNFMPPKSGSNPTTNQQSNFPPPTQNQNPSQNQFNQNSDPQRHDGGQNTSETKPPEPAEVKN